MSWIQGFLSGCSASSALWMLWKVDCTFAAHAADDMVLYLPPKRPEQNRLKQLKIGNIDLKWLELILKILNTPVNPEPPKSPKSNSTRHTILKYLCADSRKDSQGTSLHFPTFNLQRPSALKRVLPGNLLSSNSFIFIMCALTVFSPTGVLLNFEFSAFPESVFFSFSSLFFSAVAPSSSLPSPFSILPWCSLFWCLWPSCLPLCAFFPVSAQRVRHASLDVGDQNLLARAATSQESSDSPQSQPRISQWDSSNSPPCHPRTGYGQEQLQWTVDERPTQLTHLSRSSGDHHQHSFSPKRRSWQSRYAQRKQ